MRRHILIAVFCFMGPAACQTGTIPATLLPETQTPQAAVTPEFEFEGQVELAFDGLNIGLPKPKGWETLSAEHGVFISERFARLADRGVQQGLIASVFVTPLSEFPDMGNADRQRTHDILTQLIEANPDDERRSGQVQTFEWSGYDAAYYLVSEASGPQTLIVGVTLPEEGVLLTGSVSAPRGQANMIRAAMPLLLGGVTVNGEALGRDGLDTLPESLVFPE